MVSELWLEHILVIFVRHIVPLAIGPLSDHPLISSLTLEMYIPRREGGVLEIPLTEIGIGSNSYG